MQISLLGHGPLDLQKINVEIRISTFTPLLARFSGKLCHQQLAGGFSLETERSVKQKAAKISPVVSLPRGSGMFRLASLP